MFESIQEINGQIVNNQWVEWDHVGVPNKPKEFRDIMRFVLSLLGHCMNCTALDGCYFVERNMPMFPLHERCDCKKIRISNAKVNLTAKADCPIEKLRLGKMKYKIVKLKNLKEEYKKIGLDNGSLGLLLNEKNLQCLIMFFNNVNQGDYLVLVVNRSDLDITDMILPNNLCSELEEYIENNANKIANKTSFEVIPFNECDEVELIVEKEKYFKFGIHKGDKGVIASNKATKNKILVDFGKEAEDFDGFISVDFEDIKKVEE